MPTMTRPRAGEQEQSKHQQSRYPVPGSRIPAVSFAAVWLHGSTASAYRVGSEQSAFTALQRARADAAVAHAGAAAALVAARQRPPVVIVPADTQELSR
jgi:ABC-type amino acid transport substrate-binding protein